MLNTKINVEKTAGREPASKTIVGGMFSSLKGKMGFSSSDRQIQARKLVIQDALNKAYSEFEIDNLRCLSDIKSEADALAYNHSVPLASVASKVRELAFNRRTPFRSQMIELCEDAGVEEFVVNNVKSTLDVFEDAYVVFGLHGLPLVACKVNWFNPESLIELCHKGRVSEVIGRPESAEWGRAFKDPTKYSLSGDMFYDEVLYHLEEKFDSCTSELIANSVLRTSEGMLEGAKMRVVVISSDKPSYVPIADDIKDWGGIAKIVADSLKRLDTNRIQSIRTFPKTRVYAVDLDIELPEDVKPRHECPYKLRFKVQDWIHGKGAATAEKLPSQISLTWEDIAPHCPDFISQSFSESEILQYLSKRLKWETLESVRKYREWRNSGEKFIPYSGSYYSTDGGVLGLKDEIVADFVSRSFPNYECVHDVIEEVNTPSTHYPFKNLRSLMEHSA